MSKGELITIWVPKIAVKWRWVTHLYLDDNAIIYRKSTTIAKAEPYQKFYRASLVLSATAMGPSQDIILLGKWY